MTLVLPARFPPLLAWALLALLVDLAVSLMVTGGDQGAGVVMLFQIAGFLSWVGAIEALSWISQDSPWAKARQQPKNLDELRDALHQQLEPLPDGYMARRFAMLRRWDLAGWRSYTIRLMSGASLVFLVATLFLYYFADRLPDNLAFLALFAVLIFIRSIPFSCAAPFLCPILLVVLPKHKPSAGELMHAGLAVAASAVALFHIWMFNQPPVGDFILAVAHAASNVMGWPYGVMMGGFVWLIGSKLRG